MCHRFLVPRVAQESAICRCRVTVSATSPDRHRIPAAAGAQPGGIETARESPVANGASSTNAQPNINPHMFRAYDIRGLAGTDLTPEVTRRIGQAWATWLRRHGGTSMVVGGDLRPHTPALKAGFIEGAVAAGCDVTDIGDATSPLMYFATIDRKTDGGVNITASHNPVEYNGIKMVEREALPISEEEIREVRDLAIAGDFEQGRGSV